MHKEPIGCFPLKAFLLARVLAEFFQKRSKIVKLTTLLGPPAKGQLSGASYRAYQKQPTEGCTNKEVTRYEAYTFCVGGSRTDGGDGS